MKVHIKCCECGLNHVIGVTPDQKQALIWGQVVLGLCPSCGARNAITQENTFSGDLSLADAIEGGYTLKKMKWTVRKVLLV